MDPALEQLATIASIGMVGILVSLAVAHAAGGGSPRLFWWGLLGPVGWLIAALRGVQERVSGFRP